MSRLHWATSAAIALGVVFPAPARGQNAAAPNDLEFKLSPMPLSAFVIKFDPDGVVHLMFDPRQRDQAVITEGYYLLLSETPPQLTAIGRPSALSDARIMRAQVLEVGEGDRFSVKVKLAPAAAKLLKDNAAVVLIRPLGSTTAQLKAVPDAAPLRPGKGPPGGARAVLKSVNNLKMIGLALHNYLSVNEDCPAVIRGPDGKPWHSWRVLLLPYLEQMALYNEYDFSQPWDSDKNRRLLDRMPDVYRDPSAVGPKGHDTHYAALTGDRTFFPGAGKRMPDARTLPLGSRFPGGVNFAQVTDGTSNTIVVAPVGPERKIPWTKPEDIDVGEKFTGFGKAGGIGTPFKTPDGAGFAPVLFLDGSVRTIPTTIQADTLRALLTINGGEVISSDLIPSVPQPTAQTPRILRLTREAGQPVFILEAP